MALQFKLANLDGLDDAVKSLYTEKDGSFTLGVDGLPEVEDVSGLKTALSTERENRKALEKRLKDTDSVALEAASKLAKEKGDFEQLYKSSQTKLETVTGERDGLRGSIAKKERTTEALRVAGELADGHNIGLLSEFIERRLQHTDDGLKVLDTSGQLTVSSLDDLKKEFSTDPRFSSLLKGNQSSGGGAAGGGNGGGAADKTLNREQFAALDPAGQMKHIKSGGSLTE